MKNPGRTPIQPGRTRNRRVARILPRNLILRDSPKTRKGRVMANVLSVDDQILVLHHLVEGTSIRSINRVTGIDKKTILRLLVKFGSACRDFLDQQMRGLELHHLEIDEQWT